jgi:penicillin-binding protein A
MSFSTHSRRRQVRRKRRVLTTAVISLVFLSAAVYLYGGRFRMYLLLNQGKTFLQAGNLEQALGTFNQVLKLHPNHAQATDAVGLTYLIQGDLVRAEVKYDQAVKLGLTPNRLFAHAKIGDGYLARGLYAPAEVEFAHALDLTPRDANARLGHAYSLHALGRVAEAIDEYRKLLALNPDLKAAQTGLARARQDLERGFMYYLYDRRRTPLARYAFLGRPARRYYPLAQYGAHVTGYVSEAHGRAGLEKALESYLPGNSVTLTINADWQRAADRAMRWRKGSLVALDPATGEILALVNHPSFDPNRVDEDWERIQRNRNEPLKNRGTEGLYQPGSIFKTITAAAALENHLALDRIFPVICRGSTRFDDQTFWCWQRHGSVSSIQEALDTSCNIAMAEVGFALGSDRLYECASRFGFGAPLQVPSRSRWLANTLSLATSAAPAASDSRFALANYSCGLGEGMVITPLHAAMLAAAIGNQGRMLSPYLVKEITNIRGETLARSEPALLTTPVSPELAAQLKTFMVDTVANGIGEKAQIKGITVAGKTGTTGDSQHGGLNGWFICFAPAEAPKIAVAVYAEREGTGMDMAAPIAREFLEDALRTEPEPAAPAPTPRTY